MALRFIFQGLSILLLFSSCAKQTFLFPANSGSYENVNRSEPARALSNAYPLKNNTEESLSVAIVPATWPEISHNTLTLPASATLNPRTPTNSSEANILFKPADRVIKVGENKFLNKHIKAAESQKADSEDRSAGYLFSILSFVFGLGGLVLLLSFGNAFFLFLGIPAIIAGLISLHKKENLKGFAIAGLTLGILEALLILLLISSGVYLGH